MASEANPASAGTSSMVVADCQRLCAEQRYEQALGLLHAALQDNPDPALVIARAKVYFEAEHYQETLDDALWLIQVDESDPNGWALRAMGHWGRGERDEAHAALARSLSLDPTGPGVDARQVIDPEPWHGWMMLASLTLGLGGLILLTQGTAGVLFCPVVVAAVITSAWVSRFWTKVRDLDSWRKALVWTRLRRRRRHRRLQFGGRLAALQGGNGRRTAVVLKLRYVPRNFVGT
jgi:tetratricopeptide (TPR) repeat protein